MKKKFLMLLTVLAGFVSAYATNGVTVGAVSLSQGGTGTIDIELNNDDYVFTAFTFKLTLPEGLSFVLSGAGKPTFEKTARFDESHTVSSSVSGQVGSFGCLSGNKAAISGTSGVLLKVYVKADAGLAAGTNLEATLSELTFSTTSVTEVPFSDVTANIAIIEKTYTVLDETSTTAPAASGGPVDIQVKRTIKANEWGTLVLPFDMTEAQLKEALGSDVKLAEFEDYEAEYTGDDVTGSSPALTEPRCSLTLLQGLPKAGKLETIIQKCVELGISEVVPVAMERSVVRLSKKDFGKKLERYQRVAMEASKQSRRGVIPRVGGLIEPKEIDPAAFDALLLAYELESEHSIKNVLDADRKSVV